MFLLIVVTIAIIVVPYTLMVQYRKSRYRKIAEELGADYIPQRFFSTGKISGITNGKQYTIENIETGGGRGGASQTHISMECQNKGIPLFIRNDFFEMFPNWKAAFAVGDRKEKVFFTHIDIEDAALPLDEKYRTRVSSVFQGIESTYIGRIKKGDFHISESLITYKVHENTKNIDKIKGVLDVLNHVIQNIENNPITE